MPTIEYLAGIIDGEGSIMVKKQKQSRNLNWNPTFEVGIRVGMTYKPIIETLYKTFGGSFFEEKRNKYKTIYRWNVWGNTKVLPILKALKPHLRVKKEQTILAIQLLENRVNGYKTRTGRGTWLTKEELQFRNDIHEKVKALNA